MRKQNSEKCFKKTVALALTLTLTVPMTMPAFCVDAQEVNVQENDVEVVEDMDYVVYIDTTEEIDGTEDKDFVEEEISISHNTVSENIVLNESNKEQEYIVEYNSEDAETLQESIERAEEILSEEGAELIKDEEAIIYTADLTQGEIEELQESEASIIVEENIELFGASKKSQIDTKKENKKEKKEGNKKSTKETKKSEKEKEKVDKQKDSNKKKSEAYELKMALKQSSSETEEKEPEWNVNMVNGDVVGQMEGDIVKVAVMDSGIELLSGIPVQQISNLVATEQDLPYYMNDMTGHGTAIAGIINDIAPNAEIYSVRIMDAENKATLSRVVEGIYWCIENDIDIINMSFGTTVKSAVLEKAIQDANDAGILLISSAGNGDTQGVEYPAAYEEVIAVGAVNTSAEKTEESAVGEEVELVAPGEQILSDSMLGLETVVSGTSMAAPHVTAVAAVLWQKDKTKSPAFIRSLLAQTANELGDSDEYGNGLIDLEYALAKYDEFAKKYEEVEKDITPEEGISTNSQEEQKSRTQSDLISPIVEEEEQLVKENVSTVETYEEVEYVEGRWGEKTHKLIVDYASNAGWTGITFSQKQIAAFKAGAIYPDKVFNVDNDPNDKQKYRMWHGGNPSKKNYISNYILCTIIGKYAGNEDTYKKAKRPANCCYKKMFEQVNSKGIKGTEKGIGMKTRTWDEIAALNNLTNGKTFRRYFIYGMASHIVTDTYCHSAYIKQNGKYVKLKELKGDDKTNVYPNRYIDAREALINVIVCCYYKERGSEIDFSPCVDMWVEKNKYYLRNVLKYAIEAAYDFTPKELKEEYKVINY